MLTIIKLARLFVRSAGAYDEYIKIHIHLLPASFRIAFFPPKPHGCVKDGAVRPCDWPSNVRVVWQTTVRRRWAVAVEAGD